MGSGRSKIVRSGDGALTEISGDGARLIAGRPLLELDEGSGAFDVREVRVEPGGVSADHVHPWEQANYILRGRGTVTLDGQTHDVGPGDFVYVAPNVRHVFVNSGAEELGIVAARGPRT